MTHPSFWVGILSEAGGSSKCDAYLCEALLLVNNGIYTPLDDANPVA
jgi:hypothetical protein